MLTNDINPFDPNVLIYRTGACEENQSKPFSDFNLFPMMSYAIKKDWQLVEALNLIFERACLIRLIETLEERRVLGRRKRAVFVQN